MEATREVVSTAGWQQDRTVRRNQEGGEFIVLRLLGDGLLSSISLEMDGFLWSRMPSDLLSKILLLLPRVAQFRLRAVCKAWRSLLSSPGLQRMPPVLWAVAFPWNDKLSDQGINERVRRVNLQQTLPHYGEYHCISSNCSATCGHFRCYSYDFVPQDGMLSVKVSTSIATGNRYNYAHFHDHFLINPSTSTWLRLPLDRKDHLMLGKAKADVSDGNTRITYTETGPEYESRFRASYWTTGSTDPCMWARNDKILRLPARCEWFHARYGKVVFCKGVAHALHDTPHNLFLDGFPFPIYSGIPDFTDSEPFYLVERAGSLYLVVIGDLEYRILILSPDPDGVGVVWAPISVMPFAMFSKLRDSFENCDDMWDTEMFKTFGAGDYIFLIFRSIGNLVQVACFDLVTESWEFCFQDLDPRDLGRFDAFFEVRLDLHLYKGENIQFTSKDAAGYFKCSLE